jgi:acyl dehydratase
VSQVPASTAAGGAPARERGGHRAICCAATQTEEIRVATLHLEDYRVGYRASAGPYLVREAEVIEFGRRFDPRPFHVDPVAARDSLFGGLVASGCHVFCIRTWLSTQLPDQPALLAGLGLEKLELPNPVRPGDRLFLDVECIGVRPSASRPGAGVVTQTNVVRNQAGAPVMRLTAMMLVSGRQA